MYFRKGVKMNATCYHQKREAFTLIELLVVIAIIGILAAILFPVFARARENARRAVCLSDAKQIGLGLMMYTQDYDERLPYYFIFTNGTSNQYSWQWAIMSYVKNPQIFICPSAEKLPQVNVSHSPDTCDPTYSTDDMNINEANSNHVTLGGWGYNYIYLGESTTGPGVNIAAIANPSNTVFAAEANGLVTTRVSYPPYYWINAANDTTCVSSGVNTGDGIATWHFDGTNTLFADGHVKWMKKSSLEDYNGNGKPDDGWWCIADKSLTSSTFNRNACWEKP